MIVFCIAFGVVIGQMGVRAKVMFDFFQVFNEIIMKLINVIMWSVNDARHAQSSLKSASNC